MVRYVAPSKPAGPYLITSYPDWWRLDDAASWKEPRFAIGYSGAPWVTPMPAGEAAARIEMRVQDASNNRYTVGSFDGQDITRIGYVSQFGDATKQVVMTKTEGTVGLTGEKEMGRGGGGRAWGLPEGSASVQLLIGQL